MGEQNLLQLTHLRPEWCHLVLGTCRETGITYPGSTGCVFVSVFLCVSVCVCPTCSCRFVCVSSSAFFSSDDTHSFLFCLQRVAAARLRSRNFCLRSSGSWSVVLLRRLLHPPSRMPPPLQLPTACSACWEWGGCEGCICCGTGDNWGKKGKLFKWLTVFKWKKPGVRCGSGSYLLSLKSRVSKSVSIMHQYASKKNPKHYFWPSRLWMKSFQTWNFKHQSYKTTHLTPLREEAINQQLPCAVM